jgi:hypothetical protein
MPTARTDTHKAIAGLVFSAGLMVTSATNASDVFVSETGLGAGQASGSLVLPVGTNNVWAGLQTISVAAEVDGASASSFLAYCVDPAHYSTSAYIAFFAPAAKDNLETVFVPQAATMRDLFNRYYAGTINDNANAAAFQLALWEIVDDNRDLATGSVRANASTNSGLVGNATALLNNLSYLGPSLYDLTVYRVDRAVAGASGQDYIVASPKAGFVTSIPEPEPYVLILAGLGMIGLCARRRRGTFGPIGVQFWPTGVSTAVPDCRAYYSAGLVVRTPLTDG